MKKILSLIAWFGLTACFMACDNDVESYDVRINPITPDSTAAGLYEGTWERMLLTDSSVVEGEGSVVIESDTAYLITLHFVSEEFNLKKSAGVGVRIFLPMIGLMGIDWAYGFDKPFPTYNEVGGSQIHFIIGQEF